jgi:hypothetical protein
LLATPVFAYSIVTCIPVKEHSGLNDCEKKLKDALKGEYIVQFPLIKGVPSLHFEISDKHFGVVPEGGVAIVGLRGKVKPDTYSLIIDVGHITTDIALFKGKTMFGKVLSSHYAGSTLIGNVRSALDSEGFYLSDEQVANAIPSGIVYRGSVEVDVSEVIRKQKEIFVNSYLKREIIQVLNMNAINVNQVQNIVPIGAPMNRSSKTGDLISMITDACGMQYSEVCLLSDDLRYVNIRMASNFTRVLMNKAIEF